MAATKVCRMCNELKDIGSFAIHMNKGKMRPFSYCRPCNNKRRNLIRKQNLIKTREMWRSQHLKSAYGITIDEYNVVLSSQGGVCAICGSEKGDAGRRLCVDHNHVTGRNRGLLCNKCNYAVGLIGDNPEVAKNLTDYLIKYREVRP